MAHVTFVNILPILETKYKRLQKINVLWENPDNTPEKIRAKYEEFWTNLEEQETATNEIQEYLNSSINIIKQEQDVLDKINTLLHFIQNVLNANSDNKEGFMKQTIKKYDKIRNHIKESETTNNEIQKYLNINMGFIQKEQDVIDKINIIISKTKQLLNNDRVSVLHQITRKVISEKNENLPNTNDEIGKEAIRIHDTTFNERKHINNYTARNNVGGKKRRSKNKTHKNRKTKNKKSRKYFRNK